MRRNRSRMRRVLGAAGAFGLLVLLPTMAEAQLFPNATIKRQRVPCCEEPSIYSLYRRQYYGYYPTCWRRFPTGWGCPSPEAPNSAAAMEEIRRDLAREGSPDAGANAEPGMEPDANTAPPPVGGGQAPPPRGPIPLPGDERSPFEEPEPGTPPAPRAAPAAPDALPSPFDDLPPPSSAPALPPGASALPPLEVPPSMIGEAPTTEAASRAPRRSILGGALASARDRLRR